MDVNFLQRVQSHGWKIQTVEKDSCTVSCPNKGCGMRAKLKAGVKVPSPSMTYQDNDNVIEGFEAARVLLRERRQQLGLTMGEVEHAAGLSVDHIAKMEKRDNTRTPRIDTLALWAEALGFKLILRPKPLPKITVRMLADTRHLLEDRQRLNARQRLSEPR